MCKAATCPTCKKQTWTGCGAHVPDVMIPVPPSKRCECFPFFKVDGTHYPPKAGTAMSVEKGTELGKEKADEEPVGWLAWVTMAFIIAFISWAIYNKYYGGGSMPKVEFNGRKDRLRGPGSVMMGGGLAP